MWHILFLVTLQGQGQEASRGTAPVGPGPQGSSLRVKLGGWYSRHFFFSVIPEFT